MLVFTALAGCSDLFSPNAKSRLNENRDKWHQWGSTTYTFTLSQSCFCAITGPVRVAVSNGVVVTATQISTGQAVDIRFVSTIESLFDFIERGIANHSAVLKQIAADPARITAVDLNAAHVALCRLKLAAARHLDTHADFYRLFGEAGSPANVSVYEDVLRPHLDHMTRAYRDSRDWRGRRRICVRYPSCSSLHHLGRETVLHLNCRRPVRLPRHRLVLHQSTADEESRLLQRRLRIGCWSSMPTST